MGLEVTVGSSVLTIILVHDYEYPLFMLTNGHNDQFESLTKYPKLVTWVIYLFIIC